MRRARSSAFGRVPPASIHSVPLPTESMDGCHANMADFPSDVLITIFGILGERGHLSPTTLVCKSWSGTCVELVSTWNRLARNDDFSIVQFHARSCEHLRIKHLPSGSKLDVNDVGVYDADQKPHLKVDDSGAIQAFWRRRVGPADAAKQSEPEPVWVMRNLCIESNGLRWVGPACDAL